MTKDENGAQYQKSNDEALQATIQIRRRRIRNKHFHREETGDNDGKLLTESNGVVERWTQYCTYLYNYELNHNYYARLGKKNGEVVTQVHGS